MNEQGSVPLFALWALAAGAGIPVMATLNGALARALGHPAPAALALFTVGFAASLALTLALKPQSLGGAFSAPAPLYFGGLIVAFYVVSVTVLAPRFGVGNTILFVMTAQIGTSAAIDHFGLFGAPTRPVGVLRLSGLLLMIAGLALAQFGAKAR